MRRFYPSLHVNLGDTYLRLGDAQRARLHVEQARASEHVLGDDHYGRMIRSLMVRLSEATE